jgi:hypothetical protein
MSMIDLGQYDAIKKQRCDDDALHPRFRERLHKWMKEEDEREAMELLNQQTNGEQA